MMSSRPKPPAFRLYWPLLLPLLVFLLGAAMTLVAWRLVGHENQRRREAIFDQEIDRVINNMTRRLENNQNALGAAGGLFSASREVERDEWRRFVSGIEFESRYPGLYALGYIERVPSDDVPRHEARVRQDSAPGYRIWPSRAAEVYYPVVFIEPHDRIDPAYLGFDHGSHPVCLEAMTEARNTDRTVVTATSIAIFPLAQDDVKPRRGLILYKPFFRVEAGVRQDAPAGFIAGWVEADALFRDIVAPLDAPHMDYQVYDGVEGDPEALVFDFHHPEHFAERIHALSMTRSRRFSFAGKTWTIRFKKALIHDDAARLFLPLSLLLPGLLVSALLALVTYRLVSSRRRAQRRAERMTTRFEESEERFRSIVENLPGVIYRCANDADYTMEYISDGIRALSGYPSDDFIDNRTRSYASIIHPDDLNEVVRDVNRAVESRKPYVLEYRLLDASGGIHWVYEKGQGVFDAGGQMKHLDGAIFEITDRKLLENQLVTAQKMEMMGRMVGSFAHDFNNIMMILRFHAERLLDGPPSDEATRSKSVEGLKRAMDRADGLARHLLAFSRRQAVRLEPLDLNALVRSTAEMIQPLLPSACRLILALDETIGLIQADENQMTQILMNLAVNARDAMPKGGDLTITTGAVTVEQEILHRHGRLPAGEYIRLDVTDAGQGIDEMNLPHIFEPFFTTKTEDKGTGLGLAVVYGVLNQHGARIVCESRLGDGATFRIYFPKAE